MRRNILARYFEALFEGDLIALGATAVFVIFLIVIGIVAWRAKAEERRYEEEKRNKYLKK